MTAPSVPAEYIKEQRRLGWPDIHPEHYCHRCGRRNFTWFASREDWLKATQTWSDETGREGICCLSCFVEMSAATGDDPLWEIRRWKEPVRGEVDLDAAEKLAGEATPGPWTTLPEYGMIENCSNKIFWPANAMRADDEYRHAIAARIGACGTHAELHAEDNLRFIAASRTLVPQLIAAVREARAERDAAVAERDSERQLHAELSAQYHDATRRTCQSLAAQVESLKSQLAESQRIASTCVGPTEMQTAERIADWMVALRDRDDPQHGRLAAHERSLAAGIREAKWQP